MHHLRFSLLVTAMAVLTAGTVGATDYVIEHPGGDCRTLGGTWDAFTRTCTIEVGVDFTSSDTVRIVLGATLYFHSSFDNDGEITVEGEFIWQALFGTLNNSGTIDVLGRLQKLPGWPPRE